MANLYHRCTTAPRLPGENLVQPVYRVSAYVVDQVRVGIHRLRYRRVPEQRLDLFRVLASREKRGCERVSQRVEREAVLR